MANIRSTALTTSTVSPPTPGVSIAATFTFLNGTPITVNSGDLAQLKKGIINFSLSEPLVLGSLRDFMKWLTEQFGLPDISSDVDGLEKEVKDNPLLNTLYQAFKAFIDGVISITVLSISRTADAYSYQLAVTMDFSANPINFFDVIKFDSIGISVNTSGTLNPAS